MSNWSQPPSSLIATLAAALFCFVAASCKTQAAVVYESIILGSVQSFAGEIGDTVTLAGSERSVSRITIGVNGYNGVVSDNFQMRLWTADGPGGTVGTLLWQSSVLTIPVSSGFQMIPFDVPGILVPDTLIWDVSHSENGRIGFQWAGLVVTGSSPNYAWNYRTIPTEPFAGTVPANFLARIEALPVPEPSLSAVFGFGAICFGRITHKRRAIRG